MGVTQSGTISVALEPGKAGRACCNRFATDGCINVSPIFIRTRWQARAVLTLRGRDEDEAGAAFLRFAKQMTYLAPLCAHRFLRNPGRPLSGNDAWTKLRRAMWIGIILGLLAGAASGSIPAALTLAVAGGAIGWMVSRQSASAAAGDSRARGIAERIAGVAGADA